MPSGKVTVVRSDVTRQHPVGKYGATRESVPIQGA